MGISENNLKWLDGIKIHRPTLHELMKRQLRKINAMAKRNETIIDDGNGKPLMKIVDSERGNVPMEIVIKQWLDGIGENVPVGDDKIDDTGTHDLSIMDFVDINDYGENGFKTCAQNIRELVENNYVVIIQSEFGFGNLDVPFTMLVRNSGNTVDVLWLDADWQYYNTTDFDGKKWKPCYDGYIENTPHKLSLDVGEQRATDMVDGIIRNVSAYISDIDVNNENDVREQLPELDFFKHIIMWGDGLHMWSCDINEFETKLCEYLKSEYVLTPEQYYADHPDQSYEDIKTWDWEWDDPDEYYCCSYYIIYKHSLLNEILKKI